MKNDENAIYEQTIQIKDLIRAVQSQLIASESERKQAGLPQLFAVKELELEMSFVLEEDSASDCGVSLKILDAKNQEETRKERTHKLRLLLSTDFLDQTPPNEDKPESNAFYEMLAGYHPDKAVINGRTS